MALLTGGVLVVYDRSLIAGQMSGVQFALQMSRHGSAGWDIDAAGTRERDRANAEA